MDIGYGYTNFERFRNLAIMINRSDEAVAQRKGLKEEKRSRAEEKEKAKG